MAKSMEAWGNANNKIVSVKEARYGDIFFRGTGNNEHTGFIYKNNGDGTLQILDGNGGDNQVSIRPWVPHGYYKIIRPNYPSDEWNPTIKSVKAKTNSLVVHWKKPASTEPYYGVEIQVSSKSNFSKKKTQSVVITDLSTTKIEIDELESDKKYYVRMRCIYAGGKKKGKWSKKVKKKTKKEKVVVTDTTTTTTEGTN